MKVSSDPSPCQPVSGPFASGSDLQQSATTNRPYASKAYWERRFENTENLFEWYAGWKQLAFVVFDTVLPLLREQQGRCRENRERDRDLNCCAVGEDWSDPQRQSVRQVSESTDTPFCGDSCSVKSRPDHRSERGSREAGGFSKGHGVTVFQDDQSATELPKWDSEVNSASQRQTHVKQRIHPGDSAGSYRPAVTVMLGCGTSCLALDLEEHGRFPLVLNIDFCRKPLEQLRHRARFPPSLGCSSSQAIGGNGVSSHACSAAELFKTSPLGPQTQLPSWVQPTRAAPVEFPSKTKSTAGVQPPSRLLHSCESARETRKGASAGRGQLWLEADARALPLRTGSVDLVIDKGLLDAVASRDGKTGSDAETAARVRSVLKETGRVLDPKGCLLLITHSSSKAVQPLACALCSMYGVGNSGLDSLRTSTKTDRDPHSVAARSEQGGGRVAEHELNSTQEAAPPLTHAACEAEEATHRTRRCLLSRNQCSCGQYWDILREDTVALSPAVAVANLVNVALAGHRSETPSPQESTGNETDATQLLESKVREPGEDSEDGEATQRHERNAAIRQWQTLQIARRFFRLARARVSASRSPRSDAPRSSLNEQSLETSLELSDGGRVERTVTNGADADNGVGESDQNGAPALHLEAAPGDSGELRVDRKDQGRRQGHTIGEGMRVSEAECVSREETGDNGEKCGTEERSGAGREKTPVDTRNALEKKKTDKKNGVPLSSAKSYDTHLLRSVVYAITLRKRNLAASLDSETSTDESLCSSAFP